MFEFEELSGVARVNIYIADSDRKGIDWGRFICGRMNAQLKIIYRQQG